MTDALTARLKALLGHVTIHCDCPRCDLDAFGKLLTDHLVAAGTAYCPEHLRAAWEKPTPRRRRGHSEGI